MTRRLLVCARCFVAERWDAQLIPIRDWPVQRRAWLRPEAPWVNLAASVEAVVGPGGWQGSGVRVAGSGGPAGG
ncbi:hypothetical protein [Frankia sp. ACN1ag]|uniref:hypothetical protein n=1 Tax=Frankia sp. ACN1ag TaxID=102891 RepID=UPI00128EFB1D|nr:hypothetical protein [Frankia sp. ACN1ag]